MLRIANNELASGILDHIHIILKMHHRRGD
jgi:hypothetical protein